MPLGDWQFWVVTLLALGGVWMLVRAVVPKKRRKTRVELTIGHSGNPETSSRDQA